MRTPIAIAIACIAAVLSVDAAPANCNKTYKVVSGDNCYTIGQKFSTNASNLITLNSSINSKCTNLKVGQTICISKSSASNKKTTVLSKTTKKSTKTTTKKTTKKTTTKKTTTKKTTTKKTTTKKTTTKKTTTKSTTTKPTPTKTNDGTAAPTLTYTDGLVAAVNSASDFCMFLPSSPGGKDLNNGKIDDEAISKSEKSAHAFCLKKNDNAPGARIFPDNFIKSAHFFRNTTANYIQVTGKFNPAAYSLSTKDGGGQYDNHGKGSPPLSMCYGYKYFVNLVEPDKPDYCMRCCDSYEDCHAGRSTYGCGRVVQNGNYN